MRAYKTIWRWAGYVDDVVGRLRVIGWGIVLLSGVAFVVWASVLRTFGVVGTVVLILGVVFFVVGVIGVVAPTSRSYPPLDGPPIDVFVPDRPCELYEHAAGGKCVYCHLKVAALADLRRCHARLVRVEQAINQQWVQDPRFSNPVRLKWATVGPDHPEAEYRDIRKGESALLDVLYTLERSPGRAFVETLDPKPIEPSRDLLPGIYVTDDTSDRRPTRSGALHGFNRRS